MKSNAWLLLPRPLAEPRLRLFCFPNAGAAASVYFKWPSLLPEGVEVCAVQPPGRANRLREPPHRALDPLVDALHAALAPLLDRPFAVFGHSLGATVAYAWTRRLQEEGRPLPEVLFASARQAPHLPRRAPDIRHLPDAAFLEQLVRLYDAPRILLQHAELAELVLPALRADFEIVETWRHRPGAPLRTDVVAIAGRRDALTPPEEVAAWSTCTTGAFTACWLDAGHGFLESEAPAVAAIVGRRLSEGW